MTTARFFLLLGVTTLVAAIGVALLHAFLPLGYALAFSVFTVIVFIVVCLGIFFLGRRSAGAKNKHLFSNVFMGATMLKMLLCAMLVVAFVFVAKPADKLFILPFFWTYLVYTAFEVYFLMKLSGTVAPA